MNNNPVKEFEKVIYTAELKAWSKISLERPLTDDEFNHMMELKKIVFGGD